MQRGLSGIAAAATSVVEYASKKIYPTFGGSFKESDEIQSGNPSIRRLKLTTEYIDEKNQVRRFSHGPKRNEHRSTKTILLVGPTGSGKSTALNALINSLLGVGYQSNHRFWITVDENPGEDQVESKTRYVTCYELYHQTACFPRRFNFNLRIIDTPGFGDTSGKERDEAITGQLSTFFKGQGKEGIDSLEAIALVVKGSTNRLTEEQVYIFNKIMDVFGKDMAPSVLVLATHCDDEDGDPNVIAALKQAKVPMAKHFVFSNTVFFRQHSQKEKRQERNKDDFDSNKKTYEHFLNDVSVAESRSLTQTKEQLIERERLELRVDILQKKYLPDVISQVKKLENQIDIFHKNRGEIEKNSEFEWEEEAVEYVRAAVGDDGYGATNCKKCNVTCHSPCWDTGNWFFGYCHAFKSGACVVCPGECSVAKHEFQYYEIVRKTYMKQVTVAETKEKYEKAMKKNLTYEGTLIAMITKLESTENTLMANFLNLKRCLERIQQIAMNPDPKTVVGYIDVLLEKQLKDAKGSIRIGPYLEGVKEKLQDSKVQEGDTIEFHALSESFQYIREEMRD